MKHDDIAQLKSLLGDLRFIQAAALVGSKLNENKDAIAYMRNLSRLERVLDAELAKKLGAES